MLGTKQAHAGRECILRVEMRVMRSGAASSSWMSKVGGKEEKLAT